jgi:tetratricopeptide (TPR) repeat protein
MSPNIKGDELSHAFSDASKANELAPHDVDVKVALGLVQLRQGNLRGALGSFEQAASLSPDNPEVHYLYGSALMESGQVARTKDEWGYGKVLDPMRWPYIVNPMSGCGPRAGHLDHLHRQ